MLVLSYNPQKNRAFCGIDGADRMCYNQCARKGELICFYGMKQLVRDASLYVDTGDKVRIIGMSGTGKSTLLRILAQAEDPDSGTVQVFPNVRISYMSQNADMNERATVLEQVFLGLSQEYREIAAYEARTMLNRLGIT